MFLLVPLGIAGICPGLVVRVVPCQVGAAPADTYKLLARKLLVYAFSMSLLVQPIL